nr:hypothetical protein [Acholeplasmatales bacterium]
MELLKVKGVGKATLEELNKENVYTVDELLYHYPSSYEIYEFNDSMIFTGEYVTIKTCSCNKPYFINYRKNVYQVIFY